MFIDKAKIYVKSGKGGDGCLCFHREKYKPLGGPDGGKGGAGGDVIIVADGNLRTLLDLRRNPHYIAKNGESGSGNNRYGATAEDLFVKVPPGTLVKKNNEIIADLVKPGQQVKVAAGGRGGRGNASFKTSRQTAPRIAEKGQPGEDFTLELELKLIADVGIIGYPNAGKSTLISKISSARPKIADYPFTTLAPNLGVVNYRDKSLVFADIPGLIEGAHSGKGLGDEFLRHVERTKILLHIVDAFGFGGKDAYSTYVSINNELKSYSKVLSKKYQVVALNKMDMFGSDAALKQFKKHKKTVFPISAVKSEGLNPLLGEIFKKIDKVYVEEKKAVQPESVHYGYAPEYTVEKIGDIFVISGRKITDLAAMTDFREEEALRRFRNILKKLGVARMLKDRGAAAGDTVRIGSYEFIYEGPSDWEEVESGG